MPPERAGRFLADVNVLLAAVDVDHAMHASTAAWLASVHGSPIALCRATQTGLLRLLSEPLVMHGRRLTQRDVWDTFDALVAQHGLSWLQEPDGVDRQFRSISMRDEAGAKRWADDYLMAFATAADLSLVTFDKALASRASRAILLTP